VLDLYGKHDLSGKPGVWVADSAVVNIPKVSKVGGARANKVSYRKQIARQH